MPKKYIFSFILTAFVSVVLMQGCVNNDEDIDKQRETMLSWLSGKDAYSDYEEISRGVYRVITPPEDGRSTPLTETGDNVLIRFAIYKFSSSFDPARAGSSDLIYSNIEEMIPAGLDWDTDILDIRIGSGAIIKGVDESLIDCAPGDVLTVFLTSDNAYGSMDVMSLPKDTPIVWVIGIESVIQ